MYRAPDTRLHTHAAVLPRAAALGVLGLIMLVMAARTWRTWADPLVDFGREAYVPWRITQGARLYVDLAYFNGPLSPHVNAAAMWAAGPTLSTLFLLNAVFYVAIIGLSFHVLRVISGVFSSFVACAVAVLLCGFNQPLTTANYNYLAPYSHEITHGLLLSIGAISALLAFVQNRRGRFLFLSGLCAGGTLLTKPELALAALPACGVGVLLTLLERRVRRRRWFERFGLFAGGVVTLPALALLGLRGLAGLGWADAGRGVLGAWKYLFDAGLRSSPYYKSVAGTGDLASSFHAVATAALLWLCVAAAGMAAGLVLRSLRRGRVAVGLGIAAAIAGAGIALAMQLPSVEVTLFNAFAGHGVLMIVSALVLASLAYHRGRPGLDRRLIGAIVLTLFASLLLAKIRFNVRVTHYGFALAMPALLVGTVALVGWVPAWIDRRGGCGWLCRGAALGALLAVTFVHVRLADAVAAGRAFDLGHGPDTLRVFPAVGAQLDVIVRAIETQVPSTATLAVLPEGSLINVWTRRPSSVPFMSVMPPEAVMFGSETIAHAFEDRPPDYVVLDERSLTEYGYRGIVSYLPGLMRVLHTRYDDVTPPLLRGSRFRMLRRDDAPRL